MTNFLEFHNSREYADSLKPLNDQRFANSRFKTGPLQSKVFKISHSTDITCMELSHDETFFITGGYYDGKDNVLKLSMGDVMGIKSELKPTVIHYAHNEQNGFNSILCLAISPDDHRIFSSCFSRKILVHDIERSQLLHSFPQDGKRVYGISVQPSSHNGDVFAAGSIDDGVLRIFDIRSSTTAPMIKKKEGNGIFSVAFSPSETTHGCSAGLVGAKIIDIRQPYQDFLLLSSADRCMGIRYDSKGDRLIYMENAGPQVIDLASFISGGENEGKRKLTPTVEKDHNWADNGACCFAGANDELVVAASRKKDLHVWSVPEGRFDRSTIHQQLMHLTFNDQQIIGIFYSKQRSTLVSCCELNHIKAWTSFKLPQASTNQ